MWILNRSSLSTQPDLCNRQMKILRSWEPYRLLLINFRCYHLPVQILSAPRPAILFCFVSEFTSLLSNHSLLGLCVRIKLNCRKILKKTQHLALTTSTCHGQLVKMICRKLQQLNVDMKEGLLNFVYRPLRHLLSLVSRSGLNSLV